jgi:molybdopterin synthase catalytic subunit
MRQVYLDVVLLPRFAVVAGPLSLDGLTGAVREAHRGGIGAVATFAGLVRGENLGRSVTHLDYEAYEPLAVKSFTRIAEEIAAEWPDATVGVHHRVGRVEIGDASIVIVAVSAHRAAAFAACRYVIERVKQIAPVWKHEHFDGGDVWIEGATAQPDDDGARAEARRRACA